MSLAAIHAAIPHRAPFLLLDEIVSQDDDRIVCRKHFTADEWFFAGHYPDHPLVPGVLLCEAALQAGAVLLAGSKDNRDGMPMVTRITDARFKHPVHPGDTIEIEVSLREILSSAYFFEAAVTCASKPAARLEFACMLVPQPESAT
jgi:3-hydroxyacyl-[acyl-carrier-protein] dehydratase